MGQPAYYNHCDNLAAVYIINKGSTAHPLIMHALRLLFWLSAIYNFRFTAVYVQGHLNTIADAMSRLHEHRKCVAFYRHLQQVQPCQLPDSTPLTQYMSLRSCDFLFSRIQGPPTGSATSRRNLSVPLSHLCLGH